MFRVRAEPGSEVYVAGSFNDWAPAQKRMQERKGDGVYTATLMLPKGEYEYKFIINGVWCIDPECPAWVQNRLGTLNSVRLVD
jgi:1,4-alpha-glucan branching enzyme